MLYYTGARISEISELSLQQMDFIDKTVILRTLKRRRYDVSRQIPLPDFLILELENFIEKLIITKCDKTSKRLWSFSTRTGSRIVKRVMNSSEIYGARACSLGLRLGFAVNAVTKVPLTQVQIWMGHAYLSTTSIYLRVSGDEERGMAERMWNCNK